MHYGLTTRIEFCYGHRITGHQGKCAWLHGHNGLLEISLASQGLNEIGMVADFSDVKAWLKQWVNEHMDHAVVLAEFDPLITPLRDYNQRLFVMDKEPTAENMLEAIYNAIKPAGFNVTCLTLWESANNAARLNP